jgi:hypothetical protein
MSGAGEEVSGRFRGAMPKDDTGGSRFLANHPTFDGRGVVVCIFDTGVDPGAAGLQTTSTGAPKIVDLVDCTGSGDVDCSVVRKTADDGVTIEGLHGAKLTVNRDWANPSGDWHVGARRLYELFPDGLVARMRAERARAAAAQQRPAVAAANAALAAFNKAHPKASEVKHPSPLYPSPSDLTIMFIEAYAQHTQQRSNCSGTTQHSQNNTDAGCPLQLPFSSHSNTTHGSDNISYSPGGNVKRHFRRLLSSFRQYRRCASMWGLQVELPHAHSIRWNSETPHRVTRNRKGDS